MELEFLRTNSLYTVDGIDIRSEKKNLQLSFNNLTPAIEEEMDEQKKCPSITPTNRLIENIKEWNIEESENDNQN